MAGQPTVVQEQKKDTVTPFSQTSMGRGKPVKVTPFSETSMAKDKPPVTVSPSVTTPKTLAEKQSSKPYEQNRLKEGEKFKDRGEREAVNASGFLQANKPGSAFNTGKDESKRPKTVTIDGQTVAARQTVASLPSDYKKTEAAAFKKAEAFQKAKSVADRNPNVSINTEGRAEATNNTGVAKAQAAAVNRTIDQKSISQVKAENEASMRQKAAERNAAFQAKKAAEAKAKADAKKAAEAKAKADGCKEKSRSKEKS